VLNLIHQQGNAEPHRAVGMCCERLDITIKREDPARPAITAVKEKATKPVRSSMDDRARLRLELIFIDIVSL
jgi:hypothetical protein